MQCYYNHKYIPITIIAIGIAIMIPRAIVQPTKIRNQEYILFKTIAYVSTFKWVNSGMYT